MCLSFRMALSKLLWTQPDTPQTQAPTASHKHNKTKSISKGFALRLWRTSEANLNKTKTVAITDGETVTTVTLLEEFESKVKEGFAYVEDMT